jgi:hypothetical protein
MHLYEIMIMNWLKLKFCRKASVREIFHLRLGFRENFLVHTVLIKILK